MSQLLSVYFNTWEKGLSDYIFALFSGTGNNLQMLYNLITDGKANTLSSSPGSNLDALKHSLEKIMYAQLIPTAWAHGPQPLRPFIL
jgi:hypothetical protein